MKYFVLLSLVLSVVFCNGMLDKVSELKRKRFVN